MSHGWFALAWTVSILAWFTFEFLWRGPWIFIVFVAAVCAIRWLWRKAAGGDEKFPTINLGAGTSPSDAQGVKKYSREQSSPAPKEWDRVLMLSRPRAIRIIRRGWLTISVVSLFAGGFAFLMIHTVGWPPQVPLFSPYFVEACFAALAVALVYLMYNSIARDRALLQDGNVKVGWITDTWESGGRHKTHWITVEYDDSLGRRFEKDFSLTNKRDVTWPGEPILVFFSDSDPTKSTVLMSSIYELCVPGGMPTVRRWG